MSKPNKPPFVPAPANDVDSQLLAEIRDNTKQIADNLQWFRDKAERANVFGT
jgi:hypothetical protein